MYHTDYSSNLRKAQHKKPKNLSPSKTESNFNVSCNSELIRTVLAVGLVLLALLQMDPANAQPTAGYGKLVLENGSHPITVASVKNQIPMSIGDQQLEMNVDQSFKRGCSDTAPYPRSS